MATEDGEDGEDGEDVRRAEKVVLKRKLTGPPRLLLGKTRTRSIGEDRPEGRAQKEKTEKNETSVKRSSAAAESEAEPTETVNAEGEIPPEFEGQCDDIRNTKRRRWWSRFSSAVVCVRSRKKKVGESSEKQQHDGRVPPEGALQERGAASPNTTEENGKAKTRFDVRTTFARFRTSSNTLRAHKVRDEVQSDKPPPSFRKKLQTFFNGGGTRRLADFPLEDPEEAMEDEDASRSRDGPPERQAVTVTAEMSVCLTERPDESATEAAKEDLTETNQTGAPVSVQVVSSEKDEVSCEPADVVLDFDVQRSASEILPEQKTEVLQPSINGPSIRIELFPPDDVTQEEEEEEKEECWAGGSSSENHGHLLHLLGFDRSEQQLLQTARSLVRAAVNAAVDQLMTEQQSAAACVHREPTGCRGRTRL
ncbi:uncharacterized protein [Embiotoca jacksoni]|uniref:uncharacterized protein n=1 Tax=Embiotoca jacksoni TaxID=100190 RepID=UPI00370378FC